jgi:type III secretion protein HrpB1
MDGTPADFEVVALARAMARTLRDGDIDRAEEMLKELYELHPPSEELLVFPALIAIQRGQVQEALQFIQLLPEDQCPELKALCLNILGDPSWQGCAEALRDHPDPYVRRAMRQLLGQPDDGGPATASAAAPAEEEDVDVQTAGGTAT